MFPGKLTFNFAAAPVGVQSTAQKTACTRSANNDSTTAETIFSTVLDVQRTQIQAMHKAAVERATKATSTGNRPKKPAPRQSATNDNHAYPAVNVPQKEHADDPDADTAPTAEQNATPEDQAKVAEDTSTDALAPANAAVATPAQAAEVAAAQAAPTAGEAEESAAPTAWPTTPTAKPAVNTETVKAQADSNPTGQIATADSTDEKTSVSAPSQDASELPPTPAATGRKQAHENRDHAAHFKVMETDASTETAAAPQASPPPAKVGAGTALEASLTDNAASATPVKGQSANPVEAAGVPLVLGETAGHSQETQGAELAPAAQDSPRTQSTNTMDQIVLGLKGKLDARTGKAEIRLDPPNLGTMKVSVTLENGLLSAEFQSPSPVVRDLLQGNLEKLKTVLEGQGVAVDRLVVNAPADTGTPGQNPQASFGSATHDGRSARQYHQDPRSNNGRSGEEFARVFTQAQDAPLDLVA